MPAERTFLFDAAGVEMGVGFCDSGTHLWQSWYLEQVWRVEAFLLPWISD